MTGPRGDLRVTIATAALAALLGASVAACDGGAGAASRTWTCRETGYGVIFQTVSTLNTGCGAPYAPGEPYTTDASLPSVLGSLACTETFPTITWTVYATDESGNAEALCTSLMSAGGS